MHVYVPVHVHAHAHVVYWRGHVDSFSIYPTMFATIVKSALFLSALLCSIERCRGWDQAELDLFDLVEEVGENFYDVLHVEQVCMSLIAILWHGANVC